MNSLLTYFTSFPMHHSFIKCEMFYVFFLFVMGKTFWSKTSILTLNKEDRSLVSNWTIGAAKLYLKSFNIYCCKIKTMT